MTTIDTLEQLQNKVKDFSLIILEKEGFIKDLDYDTNILYNYFNDFDFELEDFEYKGNGEYVDREGYYYSLQDAIEEKYNNICFYDFIIQPLKLSKREFFSLYQLLQEFLQIILSNFLMVFQMMFLYHLIFL